jgi:hypothetical protein
MPKLYSRHRNACFLDNVENPQPTIHISEMGSMDPKVSPIKGTEFPIFSTVKNKG